MDSQEITFISGDVDMLGDVKELWEELNQVHFEKSLHFKNQYAAFTFATRKEAIIRHVASGKLLVAIAHHNSQKIGYCISSVVDEVGEIESIFVKSDYRKSDVGHRLMEQALAWIKSNAPQKIIVQVAAGNEEVFGFYAKYGFAPVLTSLQIV